VTSEEVTCLAGRVQAAPRGRWLWRARTLEAVRRKLVPVLLGGLLLSLAACGDDSDGSVTAQPVKDAGDASSSQPNDVGEWSACFEPSASIDTCDAYCAQQGRHCVTSCDASGATGMARQASAVTWDGTSCNCANPRCAAADRATGLGVLCAAPGFATAGNALPRASAQCCCAPGERTPPVPECDELTRGMWVTMAGVSAPCGAGSPQDYEELSFVAMPQSAADGRVVQWSCFEGQLVARSSFAYVLNDGRCSGTLSAGSIHFSVAGDLVTVHWAAIRRRYEHAPDAPKRAGDPAVDP
jgi:hypothetical protein